MWSVNPEDARKFDPNNMNQFGPEKRNLDYYRQVAAALEKPETDAVAVTAALYEAAFQRAREVCKQGCCKQVEIIVYNQDAPLDFLPSTFKVVMPCKKNGQ